MIGSKRKRSKSDGNNISRSPPRKLLCEVILLDPTHPNFKTEVNTDDDGYKLFNEVCEKLGGIYEKDYFGLRYLDKHGQRQWLELNNPIGKQIREKPQNKSTQLFSFRFKHYPKSPTNELQQDICKYLLYLQLRRDLYRGRLVGKTEDQYRMAALILQAETGDYDIDTMENTVNIADLKILPHITRKSESKILSIHKTLKNLLSSDAESIFLEEASKLETYGVEPINVKDQKGNELFVGITNDGISTFNGSIKTHTFAWNNILKVSYSQKLFMFQFLMYQKKHILGFKCDSTHAACALWKWALDRKNFFTLDNGIEAKRRRSGGSLFRRKKTYTFCGRSQKELYQSCQSLQNIPQPRFVRAQSMMTLMRSISSKTDSLNTKDLSLPNGIESNGKNYSTLPRSLGKQYVYADSIEENSFSNHIMKGNSQKNKPSSAAVGAVLDFMQALKDAPLVNSSPKSECYSRSNSQTYNAPSVEQEDFTEDSVVSDIMELVNRQKTSITSIETNSSDQVTPIKDVVVEKPFTCSPIHLENVSVSSLRAFSTISTLLAFILITCGFATIIFIYI